MNPPKNSELVGLLEMRHNASRPHLLSITNTLSQEDLSIPTVSLTDEDGSSCPIYTPVESTITPLRIVPADSMSPSPDRRPFLNSPYTISKLSFDNFWADENHDRSLNDNIDDTDWDLDKPHTTGTGYIEYGDHLYSLEGEPRNTGGRK